MTQKHQIYNFLLESNGINGWSTQVTNKCKGYPNHIQSIWYYLIVREIPYFSNTKLGIEIFGHLLCFNNSRAIISNGSLLGKESAYNSSVEIVSLLHLSM